jgi:hypothetical protein
MKSGKGGLVICVALDIFLGARDKCELSVRGCRGSMLEAGDSAGSSRGSKASCGAGPLWVSDLRAVRGTASMVWMGEDDIEGDFGDMVEVGGWSAGCEGMLAVRMGKG